MAQNSCILLAVLSLGLLTSAHLHEDLADRYSNSKVLSQCILYNACLEISCTCTFSQLGKFILIFTQTQNNDKQTLTLEQ